VAMEMMVFHQGYASASTDSLKRAIQFLDREEAAEKAKLHDLDALDELSSEQREMLKGWSESDLNLIKGMRATLAKELAARDKGTDKARRLIDSVLDASGAEQLEAFAGFCLGCAVFGFLQRRGLIPEDVCEACNNISLRRG